MMIMFVCITFAILFCSAPVGAKRRGGPGGLNKVCGVSPELQAVVGEPAMPRTEVIISTHFFKIIFKFVNALLDFFYFCL